MNNNLSELLLNFINEPENPDHNIELALYYDNIGQTASALSYYLRCAERTDDELLRYECLIRGSMCFDKQGTRNFTVKGMLQHAISVLPNRPEAYYLLSRFYEREDRDGHWVDSYMIASIGEKLCDFNCSPLRTQVDYPGDYAILYQKAIASWWCGLCSESRDIFKDLYDNYDLDEVHKNSVKDILIKLNVLKPEENVDEDSEDEGELLLYNKNKYPFLKNKFPGSENIESNYSEAYQDLFILTMLNGKREGTYLEIGAGAAFFGNNTALLDQDFGWKGISVDILEVAVNQFINGAPYYGDRRRNNKCVLKDATKINYEKFLTGLDFPNEIDYLQLDCDPASVTYDILVIIPFESYKFAVITYEHDKYREGDIYQEKSKKYLESYGYVRVVNNISADEDRPYEDWWVHPDLIDSDILDKLMCISDETKKAETYLLARL
jgi:hypothetical protein